MKDTSVPAESAGTTHRPYVEDASGMAELTLKAVIAGAIFGVLFGASTVYLALRAGLSVSASIPIAVLSISLLKRLGGSTILENNIVQTIGSAGESIASGVVFTLPGFLFLTRDAAGVSVGASYFNYGTILTLAILGGVLGVLMNIPLRRALIVSEHGTLPYPEGTACAQVLIAGEKGGSLARTAYGGLGFAFVYAILQRVLGVIAESPTWMSSVRSRVFPAATLSGDITPEYMGVGYILGIRNAGLLVAGGVLAWLGLIPLLASLVPAGAIALQLVKLGYSPDRFGYDAAAGTFTQLNFALYFAYVRQIGAGAVACGGFLTLLKTIPTIVSAFKGSLGSLRGGGVGGKDGRRTDRDLPLSFVLGGSLALVVVIAILPFIPGTSIVGKALLGLMMILFGFFFVTVSSRIVGIIGTSSNPISGMTIATLMATCLLFLGLGWTGDVYQPMALCVGGIVCIAAANAGATSQDLKTGFLVGATPRSQQIGLLVGVVASSLAIGLTVQILDNAHVDAASGLVVHAIGSTKLPAPQATLMATLIRGLLAHNLDWQFVLVGAFLSVTVELCGVSALAFAVGAYLPLSTTLPIFVGGVVRYVADKRTGASADDELGPGNLFATGLVAGGALAGVLYAMLAAKLDERLASLSFAERLTGSLGEGGFQVLGVCFFAGMGAVLYSVATRRREVAS
jgi:putative OPT family oligopeptide transporter